MLGVENSEFCLRTKASHDVDVDAVLHRDSQGQSGVQGDCVPESGSEVFSYSHRFPTRCPARSS